MPAMKKTRNAIIFGLIFGSVVVSIHLVQEGVVYYSVPSDGLTYFLVQAFSPVAISVLVVWLCAIPFQRIFAYLGEAIMECLRPRTRIAYGFHRIGIVLAVPVVALGYWFFGCELWKQFTQASTHSDDFNTAFLTFGAALGLYVGARVVGWIVEGFTTQAAR